MGVPIGKLKELGAEGKLTTDILVKAMVEANSTVSEEAKQIPVSLGKAWAVDRAMKDLEDYNYYLISCEYKRWHNPSLDSRDVKILHRAVRGWLKEDELTVIEYPKQSNDTRDVHGEWKLSQIMEMIERGKDYDEILLEIDTSREYIWKIKCKMREQYRVRMRYNRDISENLYPKYLRDNRMKEGKQSSHTCGGK